MARVDEAKTQKTRELMGTVIREADSGDWILAYKYDGKVIDRFRNAEDAFRAQSGKPKKPGPKTHND